MANVYTLFESYDGPTDFDDGYADRVLRRVAQTFTPSESHDLGRVTLRVHYDSGEKPDDVTVGIWATSAGKPVGPALVEVTVDTDDWGTDSPGELINFDFETPLAVEAETQYGIVVQGTGADFQIRLRMNNAAGAPHYPDGERKFSSNEGIGWFDGPDTELEFYEYGVTWSDTIVIADNIQDVSQQTAINSAAARSGNSFEAAATTAVTKASFSLNHGGSDGYLVAEIWEADESDLPIGAPIATSENRITDDIIESGFEVVDFVFDGSVELVQGNKYAIALKLVAVGGQTGIGIWTGTAFTSGVLVTSANSGADWTSNASWDLSFGVYGIEGAGGGGGGNIPTDVTLFEAWGF